MTSKQRILNLARNKRIKTTDVAKTLGVSRQYASSFLRKLVENGELIKTGSTHNALYTSPQYATKHPGEVFSQITKRYKNKNLEEHVVLHDIENNFPEILKLPENIRRIFTYAFSEILNNAIEHSKSNHIKTEVLIKQKKLMFIISDSGIGVFRNVLKKRKLNSELEAIQDILKGKTTTDEKRHSGEGIFFTSKAGDFFSLDSYGKKLIIDNNIPDVFIRESILVKGTRASFHISTNSKRGLNEIFKKFTNIDDESDFGFDKTEVHIRLYKVGGTYVSRSQARRVMVGLEKFKSIILDFEDVPMVGQAFVDEVFRVFHNAHPRIKIKSINASEEVKFMIKRVNY